MISQTVKECNPIRKIEAGEEKQILENGRCYDLIDGMEELGGMHKHTGALSDDDFAGFYELAKPLIDFICQRLHISTLQAILLSDLTCFYNGYSIEINELAEFIQCKAIKIMKYYDEFEYLEERDFIQISESRIRDEKIIFNLNIDIIYAAQKNELALVMNVNTKLSADELFNNIAKIFECHYSRRNKVEHTIHRMSALLKKNTHLNFVKVLKSYGLKEIDELILVRFCHYAIDREEEMDIENIVSLLQTKLYMDRDSPKYTRRMLKAGRHTLQQKDLIQNVCNDGLGVSNIFCLADKVKDELLADFKELLFINATRGIKQPSDIAERNLFYPAKTARQVDELAELLVSDKFSEVQKNLKEKGMRTGFACLFSGAPGTGKTETVQQIARRTGRAVMQVDISDTKSKWFGESEKKIKEVFTKYKTASKNLSIAPILFFNEADAIIGKRQNFGNTRNSVGQTENTIQNIILQEIENLEGILIAATNLKQNMDKAFERRFLYKIEFEKPDFNVRRSIWHELIPDLSESDIDVLSQKFDLSGGQIENIARKRTASTIMYGKLPSLDALFEYCKEESTQEVKQIGFNMGE